MITIWECDFMKWNVNKVNYLTTFYQTHRNGMNEKSILKAVVSNELFGALEVDIEVPEKLYDYFEEMCPLFVTSEVKFEDIGEYMQEHIKHHNLSQKEKTLLIGGLKAKKVLISTPLLNGI